MFWQGYLLGSSISGSSGGDHNNILVTFTGFPLTLNVLFLVLISQVLFICAAYKIYYFIKSDNKEMIHFVQTFTLLMFAVISTTGYPVYNQYEDAITKVKLNIFSFNEIEIKKSDGTVFKENCPNSVTLESCVKAIYLNIK